MSRLSGPTITIGLLVLILGVLAVVTGYQIHLRLGNDSLGAWGNYLTGVGTVALAFAAFFAGRMAIREYAERTKAEQIQWLANLFAKFFQDSLYRRTRQKIDYEDLDDIVALLEKNKHPDAIFDQAERDELDAFTDYLNFFEMIAFLSAKGKIKVEDVGQIFDYYLRRLNEIKQREAVMEYLEHDGFENLRRLLVKFKPKVATGEANG